METLNHNETNQQEKFETIDLKKLIFKVLTNWYWFALTIFVAVVLAFFINKYTEPVYTIQSSILIRDKSNSNTSGIDNMMREMRVFDRIRRKNVEDEKGILESYFLTRKTLEQLNFEVSYFAIGRIREPEIYKNSPFIVTSDSLPLNRYNYPIHIKILDTNSYLLSINDEYNIKQKMRFGEKFVSKDFNFSIKKNFADSNLKPATAYENYFIFNDINTLSNQYKNKLQISTTEEKSSILQIRISGKVIEKEVDFLNALGQTYIQMELDEKNQVNEKTILFIDEQLGIISDSLTSAENNLQQFKEENRTINLSIEGKVLFDKLEDLQKQLSSHTINQKYYEYLSKYIREKDTKDIISPTILGISDPSLNKLVVELNELSAQKHNLQMGSPNGNPALEITNKKIENLKALINENLNTIIKANTLSINDVKDQIANVDTEIRKLPNTEKQLINIQRKFTLNDEIYNFLLKKRAETGIARASNTAENRILDKARGENAVQISPNKQLNYILAIIIAILIPLMIIIILDFFDNKIHERKDIESRSQVPIIAEIGHNNKHSDLVIHKYPRSSISESFRKLRTNLRFSLANKQSDTPVISITSTISGEGKSFTSINTASVIAALEKKTVIIGLDLRKPSLHKFFSVENDIGVSEYLSNQTDLESIIRETEVPNLSMILAGTVPPNPAELIESPKMKEMIEHLKTQFDYIILDTPPVALVTDALLLSPFVDIQLYVVRQNYSNLSILEFLNTIKEKNKVNFNIILNDINLRGYYSYKYNYNYKYGGGYYSHNYYEEEIKMPLAVKIFEFFKRK